MGKRLLILAAVLVAFAFAGTGQAFAATIIVDDDGFATAPANCGGLTMAPSSIETAVESANPGDTVNVCPGRATASVSGNRVQDNTYTLAPTFGGTGILVYQGGTSPITVAENRVVRSDDNIGVYASSAVQILRNVVLDSTFSTASTWGSTQPSTGSRTTSCAGTSSTTVMTTRSG